MGSFGQCRSHMIYFPQEMISIIKSSHHPNRTQIRKKLQAIHYQCEMIMCLSFMVIILCDFLQSTDIAKLKKRAERFGAVSPVVAKVCSLFCDNTLLMKIYENRYYISNI